MYPIIWIRYKMDDSAFKILFNRLFEELCVNLKIS